jgi:arginine decarboxylase
LDFETELAKPDWTKEEALNLYLIDRWGGGYFDVDGQGHLTVAPLQDRGASISIFDALQEAISEGLRTPLLIRFQDLLRHRVVELNEAFLSAVSDQGYNGRYRGVYPIKVNQLREVVEEILDAGEPYRFGLEVGSKPEIFAGLAVHSHPESLIVCNGYKDPTYVRMALIGRKLDKKIILVVEKISEIELIVKLSKEMNVIPLLGIRLRLATKGAGKWATSGGESSKFGLSTSELLQAVEILQREGLESSLKLLHFHIGSQIPNILNIKSAVREAARYYAKLHKRGHPIEFLDVGGGLAIDYDGSKTTFHSSMNYTLEEYAKDIVYNIMDICEQEGVPHPDIVSESGRAIVAHHSVLVVEAFGSIQKTPNRAPQKLPTTDHKLIEDVLYIEAHLTLDNLAESWHDLLQIKEESQKMFELGMLDLDVRASLEILYWRTVERIRDGWLSHPDQELPEELDELKMHLADQHICNFSVFQSLLDHWALGQLFPVVPIHRLNEPPASESTLVDITCDSDGKVARFIDISDVRDTLPLHEFTGEPYYLGIFLTGAYQDIMGDIHNLFGRVNEVHIFLDEDEDSGFYIEEKIRGNTIAEVLAMTQYDSRDLIKKLKSQIDQAIKQDRLKPTEGMKLLAEYEKSMSQQTYLEFGAE